MMATTTVGVRQLKLEATQLVRRASGGQRVVITRYGKPCAVLGPAGAEDDETAAPRGSRMAEWLREKAAFERMLPRLLRRHGARWVAVRAGRVIGAGADPDALYERVWRRLGGRTFFIGRVGDAPPVIDMPGFELA
jgi:prevent-host-death family protein